MIRIIFKCSWSHARSLQWQFNVWISRFITFINNPREIQEYKSLFSFLHLMSALSEIETPRKKLIIYCLSIKVLTFFIQFLHQNLYVSAFILILSPLQHNSHKFCVAHREKAAGAVLAYFTKIKRKCDTFRLNTNTSHQTQ